MRNLITVITLLIFSLSVVAGRPVRGTYEVPVSPELQQYSSFAVKFKSREYERNPVSITFPLPQELTGVQNFITMKKSDTDANQWSGKKVQAHCSTQDRYFVCQMKFSNLETDLVQATDIIRQNNPDPIHAEAIMEVVKKFSSEGIGVLKYKLRGRDRD